MILGAGLVHLRGDLGGQIADFCVFLHLQRRKAW